MFDFINYGIDKLQIFLLVMIRTSGLFLLAPILGHRSFPMLARAGLVILLSGLIVSAMPDISIPEASSLIELAGMALRELLAGALIGFFFMLFFYATQAAGSLAGYQMALAVAAAIDPSTMTQESIIGRFWFLIASLIFLTINGHHHVIQAFHQSFELIPPGQVVIQGSTGHLIIKYCAYVFVIALKIASPVMVTLFLTDVSLGVMTKMMPTMNVFVISFGLKIATGLLVLILSLPMFSYVLQKTTNYLNQELQLLVASMGSA